MNKGDEEVLVIEECGEHGDSLLYIGPGGAGGLKWGKEARQLQISRPKDLKSHC